MVKACVFLGQRWCEPSPKASPIKVSTPEHTRNPFGPTRLGDGERGQAHANGQRMLDNAVHKPMNAVDEFDGFLHQLCVLCDRRTQQCTALLEFELAQPKGELIHWIGPGGETQAAQDQVAARFCWRETIPMGFLDSASPEKRANLQVPKTEWKV